MPFYYFPVSTINFQYSWLLSGNFWNMLIPGWLRVSKCVEILISDVYSCYITLCMWLDSRQEPAETVYYYGRRCPHIVELVRSLKHKIGGLEILLRVETAKYFVSLQCVLSTFPIHIYPNKLYLSITLRFAKSNWLYDYDHCLQTL